MPADPTLHARDLTSGTSDAVAEAWILRLKAATPSMSAAALYSGRAFFEARRTAFDLGASLAIVSAGLGLVAGEASVPSYSLTTARRDPDDILTKTTGTPADWWIALKSRSPFHCNVLEAETGPILAALSSSYLALLAKDWDQWPTERQARLRLFTKEEPLGLPVGLRRAWMPYDDRLDVAADGLAGTQGDFAQRALRHFATVIGTGGDRSADRDAVLNALEGLSAPKIPVRQRLSDEELKALIERDWDAVAGRSGAMLRRVRRELGVACEQSRFKDLFKSVQARRLNGGLL